MGKINGVFAVGQLRVGQINGNGEQNSVAGDETAVLSYVSFFIILPPVVLLFEGTPLPCMSIFYHIIEILQLQI